MEEEDRREREGGGEGTVKRRYIEKGLRVRKRGDRMHMRRIGLIISTHTTNKGLCQITYTNDE